MNSEIVDVLVAGAGAAGLSAALSAAETGLDVVVIEANRSFRSSSNTAMSTSMIPAGGSRWQAEASIDDSPSQFYDDIMAKTRASADPVLAAALTSIAPELVSWMADEIGVPLELVTEFRYPGHSVDRCLAVPDRAGLTLHRHLLEAAAENPRITLINPMRLTSVVPEPSSRIQCWVQGPDSAGEAVDAKSVVLATNGFAARQDMVSRYLPEIESALYHGGDGSTGDALMIGETLGADVAFMDSYQGHGSVATPHGVIMTWAAVMQGAVLLNSNGERFGDETSGYSEYAVPVLDQPGGIAWVVLDRRIDEACGAFKDYQDLAEAGGIRWSDDIEALASTIGAPVDVVERTLDEVRIATEAGGIDAFGRAFEGEPLHPPYGSVKVTGALFHTQGGLRVDASARVLAGGRPIGGMYAAGGAAAGISGHGASGYLAGNGLLSALGLGYLAGRDAGGLDT
jgi:fumarate reductase flavoprotein subunit